MEASHEVKEGDYVVVEGPTTGSEPVLNMEALNEHNPVGSSVLDSSSLLEENKVKLPSQKRSFSCDYCNLSFSDFRALGGHQTSHKRERDLVNKEFELRRYYQSPPPAYRHYPYTHHHSPMFSSALNRSSSLRLRYTNRPFPLGFQMGSYTNGPPFNGSNNHSGSNFGSFSSPRSPIMPHNYVPPQPLYSSRFRSFGEYHANINGGGGSGSGGGNNINIAPPSRFPGSISNHGGGVSRYLSETLTPHGNSTMDAGFLNLGNGPVEGDGGGELDLDLKL
ncbi:zinc finger protein 7-like [Impatiens glandulifera]|uniref:zinc finger protein 7-like n=1 Tax=Impatiens glandulifera TaxID=253017 RepID=UPI001FB05E71|nr:zinc finger protein 7-like [Impatiens glandulifera]